MITTGKIRLFAAIIFSCTAALADTLSLNSLYDYEEVHRHPPINLSTQITASYFGYGLGAGAGILAGYGLGLLLTRNSVENTSLDSTDFFIDVFKFRTNSYYTLINASSLGGLIGGCLGSSFYIYIASKNEITQGNYLMTLTGCAAGTALSWLLARHYPAAGPCAYLLLPQFGSIVGYDLSREYSPKHPGNGSVRPQVTFGFPAPYWKTDSQTWSYGLDFFKLSF